LESLENENVEIRAKNISNLREYLLDLPYYFDVKIPRKFEEDILSKLQRPKLGILRGAEEEYRDYNEDDSLHVRVYEDYLKAHLDRKNPIYNPFLHFFKDFVASDVKIIAAIVTIILIMSFLKIF